MHENEEATYARFSAAMARVVEPAVARHGGRIVKNVGDGFLAEFPSAVAAVRCALEFQQSLAAQATAVPPERRLLFRVGINVGDVIVAKDDIYGDHVNLAARLEQLAEPGGLMISGFVHEYVNGRLACRFEDAGERQMRNIARPVRTYRVLPDAADANTATLPDTGFRPATRLTLFGSVSLWSGDQ